jgi:hypothetical protein
LVERVKRLDAAYHEWVKRLDVELRKRLTSGADASLPKHSSSSRVDETVMMKNLKLGDVLNNGSIVDAVMKIKNENDPYYKLPGNILVTGSHYMKYGGKYIRVKDVPDAKPTGKVDPIVYCLVTSDHKIPVGDYVFWDWEDNLIPTRENVNTIFRKLKSQRSVTVK